MSARALPSGSTRGAAKRVATTGSVRSAKPASERIAKPLLLPTPKLQPTNGEPVFDAKAFLAKAGVGKKILTLKKDEAAYAQGDAADSIFYVQKGRLKVTVTSANGKEATITLVGPGEFLGENCMVSAHPVRLATATAMVDSELLKIGKAEMVRVLRDEPKLSDMFMHFLLTRNARIQEDLVDQLVQFQRKAAGKDSVTAGAVRQGKQARNRDPENQPGGVG